MFEIESAGLRVDCQGGVAFLLKIEKIGFYWLQHVGEMKKC